MTTIPEIKSEIRQKNEEINSLAHRIEDRFEEVTDWRQAVHDHPFVSVAACVGVGFLLSGALTPILRFAGHQAVGLAKSAAITAVLGAVTTKVAQNATDSDQEERDASYMA